jgi:DNA-directed RNA polymerase subunit RPC12/RpoP
MKVYKVSPIVKYSPFFSLTYVSRLNFVCGEVVPINFNNKEVLAVVLEVLSLKDAKVEIRKGEFKTKKIEKEVDLWLENPAGKTFFKKVFPALLSFSKDFFVPVGELIYFIYGEKCEAFSSHSELKELSIYPDNLSQKVRQNKAHSASGVEILRKVITSQVDNLIIKDFNFDKYMNFQSPHISKLDLLFYLMQEKLLPGIKKVTFETDFLGVAEKNFLDSKITNTRLFGVVDCELSEKKQNAKKFLVRVDRDKNGEEEVISKEVIEIVRKRVGKYFFFVLSHGFADRIFCNDCKKTYDCEKCGTGFSLLSDEEGKSLFCKNCKNKKRLKEDQYVICKHCGSWKVFPLGVGGQKVSDFLKSNLPSVTAKSCCDSMNLVDESEKKFSVKKITEQVNNFIDHENEKSILIGSVRTLKVLKSLLENREVKVDTTFVVSTGPLVKGDLFDSDEKFIKLLSELESVTKEMYLFKRQGDEIALENFKNKENFTEEEGKIRAKLGLPPFSKVLTLIFVGRNKKFVDKFISQNFEKFKPAGEIKKGIKFVYYWFIPLPGRGQTAGGRGKGIEQYVDVLRSFGDVVVANSVIEQSILGRNS